MEEIQLLIKAKYSGSISEMSTYLNLAVQASAVVIGGIILWKASAILHKRKMSERASNKFFETPYSKGWKRK